MSELPPPSRQPEPLAFDPQRDRVAEPRNSDRSGEVPSMPPTRSLHRDLLGQTIGGRYEIKGVLGEGGMGTVYDAEHLGLSRRVAIKVLSPSQAKKRVAVKRFQQEARAAGAIGHPNICEVYDLGVLEDGSPYLVMEKLVGQTLAERIANEGGLPFNDVVEVIVQVLSGLSAAHEKGIIHRDIKPENIFLARRLGCAPIIKLLDFGVSKMMAGFRTSEDSLDLTRAGMVMGTPYYMSPEQARGERNLDGRVDVYACGVVMYEAIAGRRPFLAPNYNALLLAIINTMPRPIRDIRPTTPPELEAIIQRAMEKNRAHRYASAKHMLQDLAVGPVHLGDASGARLPAPPTADERKLAPVLGGTRGRREPASGPGRDPDVTVRSLQGSFDPNSMREPERATSPSVKPPFDPSGREREDPRSPLGGDAVEGDDSIDIPIEVTVAISEEVEVGIVVDEDPTRIFRPDKQSTGKPPVNPRAKPGTGVPLADDWDGETVVKRPEMTARLHGRFNPEETMKLEGSELDNVDGGPRRRH